jgi:flagellar FliL protein
MLRRHAVALVAAPLAVLSLSSCSMLGGADNSAANGPGVAAPGEHPAGVSEVVDLGPANINLADGHYLRVAVSLQLAPGYTFASDAAKPADTAKPAEAGLIEPLATAPAKDLVISSLSGRNVETLSTDSGREAARKELLEALQEYYGDPVVRAVFLPEFVTQ